MDSDSPDLEAVSRLCQTYGAMLILDVAHDFGAMGETGQGLWESVASENRPDIVMGSFSKTFAANGGFVCCSSMVADYLRIYSSSWVFSNALSPVQAAVVLACLSIVFSEEGHHRRLQLKQNSEHIRDAVRQRGFQVGGIPSPIVPVCVGNEATARVNSRGG
jgi:7-keto-8-aminopelargonate synthetase-like enzyme